MRETSNERVKPVWLAAVFRCCGPVHKGLEPGINSFIIMNNSLDIWEDMPTVACLNKGPVSACHTITAKEERKKKRKKSRRST